jgi:hypothetical protein
MFPLQVPFIHSKRLAQSWTTRTVLVAAACFHLPVATTAVLVGLSSFLYVRIFRASAVGDRRNSTNLRRRRRQAKSEVTEPRLGDLYPCRTLLLGGFILQLACLAIPKARA